MGDYDQNMGTTDDRPDTPRDQAMERLEKALDIQNGDCDRLMHRLRPVMEPERPEKEGNTPVDRDLGSSSHIQDLVRFRLKVEANTATIQDILLRLEV